MLRESVNVLTKKRPACRYRLAVVLKGENREGYRRRWKPSKQKAKENRPTLVGSGTRARVTAPIPMLLKLPLSLVCSYEIVKTSPAEAEKSTVKMSALELRPVVLPVSESEVPSLRVAENR